MKLCTSRRNTIMAGNRNYGRNAAVDTENWYLQLHFLLLNREGFCMLKNKLLNGILKHVSEVIFFRKDECPNRA